MNNILSCILLLLAATIISVFSANILHLASVPSPSHHIWNRALAFGLAEKGHNVTYIGPDEEKGTKPNFTQIFLEGVYEELNKEHDVVEMAFSGPLQSILDFQDWSICQCKLSINSEGFQKLLNYPEDFRFDLIIIDITTGNCLHPLIQRFNYPPTVAVTPFLLPSYVSYSFGNHLYPSFIPWYGLPYTTEMSFMERFWNFVFTFIDLGLRYLREYPAEMEIAKKVIGGNIPSVQELENHISLVLANTDPLVDHPQPLPPNIIPVGGLHISKPKNISQEWTKILESAKHGVILFSLGTNIRSDKLDKNTQKAILDAFRQIPQTVIWKFESNIENLPNNVIVRKWLPQSDILGHPNVKLFIGHGGALSTQETIYHGVPIVAIPFIVDQYIHARIIVKKRLGLSIDFTRITTEYFLSQVKEVLDNPVYTANIKKLSKIFKDRTETPLERGIFWIEYVLRHDGAHFLSTAARQLPFYKSLGLDVVTLLFIIMFVTIVVLFKVVKFVVKLFTSNEKLKTN